MKEFLWKTFVKDYENYKDPEVRAGYTKLTGGLGVIVNSVDQSREEIEAMKV